MVRSTDSRSCCQPMSVLRLLLASSIQCIVRLGQNVCIDCIALIVCNIFDDSFILSSVDFRKWSNILLSVFFVFDFYAP